jgi:hypothetical protein
MLRADVATFGKASDSDEDGIPAGADQLHVAEAALRRVEGALLFADASQPAVQELRRLYEALAPLLLGQEIAS